MPGRSLLLAATLLAATLGAVEADQTNIVHLHRQEAWTGPTSVTSLRFLGATTIPNDAQVEGTLIGGLSGLDYDPTSGLWVFVSDDKSEHAPARFYQGNVELTNGALEVTLFNIMTFGQENGKLYPDAKTGGEVPDPESIRFDPAGKGLWWTSEGDRKLGLSPFVRKTELNGVYLGGLTVPKIFKMNKDQEIGPRNNNAFEGLSFTPKGDAIWLAMESSLYQDGSIASVDAGAFARFTKFDSGGKVLGEYVYPLDPIPVKSAGEHSDNGVSEVLAADDNRLLVLERSGVNDGHNHWTSHIRLYEADASDASNVAEMDSLVGRDYKPMTKRLILNLGTLPELGSAALPKIDNIEGMSFGPDLPNGHRTLVLVSDNNFNPSQITQFLAFEILP